MMELTDQARQLRVLREDYEAKQRAADEAKRAYDEAHLALWERMDATGCDSVKVDGRTFSKVKATPYATVQDKQALYRWAVEEGNAPELFEPDPRKGLLNERVRLAIDNGESLPPGLGFYTKQSVSQRKA